MYRTLALFVAAAIGFAGGWFALRQWPTAFSGSTAVESGPVLQPVRVTRIVAQGRLRPLGGIVNVIAPPGQQVRELLVAESATVEAGKTELVRLESLELLKLHSDLASARKDEVAMELAQARMNAEGAVRSATASVQSAELNLLQLGSTKQIAIAEQELKTAQEQLNEFERLAGDELTRALVSEQQVRQQKSLLESSRLRLEESVMKHEQALAAAKQSLEIAQANLADAKEAAEMAARVERENRSTALAEEIAHSQLEQSRVFAPASGTVLRVMVRNGDTVGPGPLMQIGNVQRMECLAEVSEMFANRISAGMSATLSSSALAGPLNGSVTAISRVVGSATISDPNPLALVDRKTVEVTILVDEEDTVRARDFSNLQVTVELTPEGSPPDSAQTSPSAN